MGSTQGHTPGPWKVSVPAQSEGEPRGSLLVRYDGPNHHWHIASVYYHADANARLIAAAPDLLAACKQLLYYYQAFRDSSPVGATEREETDNCIAAIASAEGGAA